jgi:soluble lytic murein transglycosylase
VDGPPPLFCRIVYARLGFAEGGRAETIRASEFSINPISIAARVRGAAAHVGSPRMRARRRASVWLLAAAMAALASADALSASSHRHGSPNRSKAVAAAHTHGSATEAKRSEHAVGPRILPPGNRSTSENAAPPPPMPPDLAAAKRAIELLRQHKPSDATTVAASIGDPVARKLVEWALLRDSENAPGFDRIAAFIQANPDWPSMPLLRRHAEARLWRERRDGGTVRGFLGEAPASTAGRLALARALMAEGDRAGAEREARAAWRSAEMPAEQEAAVLDTFRNALTPADDLARMDRRIGAKDFGAALRAAKRLGHDHETIVKACVGAEANSSKSAALLDAVPNGARSDLGYVLCRLHWLTGRDDVAAAAKLAAEAASADLAHLDTDEWWRERRVLARKLIDRGNAQAAYRVASEAALPANPYYRAEFHFLAGWIALRFLADPTTALTHFAHIDDGSVDPIVLARAAYWRGRAAEAAGQVEEMHARYEIAARYPTAYYGQLARARLGLGVTALHPPPADSADGSSELLHAADILYSIGELDLVLAFVTDLAQASSDVAILGALGQLAARHNDAQAMLVIGKTALERGLAMERYAFPEIGVPPYSPIGPQIDRCIVYSIVRTESAFDQRDLSPAKAVGLMQVTPEAGRDTAKRFSVSYDWNRLVSDPVYNTQMGAGEVTALLKEYRGSYIMTFAGYNAGRGRVRQWVAQHGDPRDPKVDAVDWVERIPLAETRNYVQRVMENLQVYRERFGDAGATTEPNLHRAAAVERRPEPDPKAAWNSFEE